MRRTLSILVVIFLVHPMMTFADRGSIPFRPDVKIFEPRQRALIAWNGEEEILLLSTDLRASQTTEVLEVIPLPSEPTVKKGDVEVFRRAIALINKKIRRPFGVGGVIMWRGKGASQLPAGEVTFHEKIGAHDISVARVLDSAGFVTWVETYLKSAGVGTPHIPDSMKRVVEEYLADNFSWFVFDVVSLDETLKTNDAIQYGFATTSLFYPLRITRTGEGETAIELLVLTPKLLSDFPGIPTERVKLLHAPIAITSNELRGLSQEMDDLLGNRNDMRLRIWRIDGNLASFNRDLIAR